MYEHSDLAEAWEAMIVEILYRQGVRRFFRCTLAIIN